MRLALLGDIHGNHLALAAALAAARDAGVERLLINGDLVGYYFWPREVLGLLDGWQIDVVRGNHEAMLDEAQRDPEALRKIDRKYGTGLRVALRTLERAHLQWLQNLPHPLELRIEAQTFLLCHGAPWDLDQYVYPDAQPALLERVAAGGQDWVICGHTHYPMQQQVGRTRIVNPGSVGQPRNRQPGAHWALLDTATREVSQRCEPYDIAWVRAQAEEIDPEVAYLSSVLVRQ